MFQDNGKILSGPLAKITDAVFQQLKNLRLAFQVEGGFMIGVQVH